MRFSTFPCSLYSQQSGYLCSAWAFSALYFLGACSLIPLTSLLNSLVYELEVKLRSVLQLINHKWLVLKSPRAYGRGGEKGEKAEAALWVLSLTAWQNLLHLFDGHSHSSSESHHFPPPRISSMAAGMGLPSNRKQGGFSLQRTHNCSQNHCLQQTLWRNLTEDWVEQKRACEKKDAKKSVRNKLVCCLGI